MKIPANKLDILIKDKVKKILIVVAKPADNNILQKQAAEANGI